MAPEGQAALNGPGLAGPDLNGQDIAGDIIALIAETKDVDRGTIELDTSLADLGFDSFDIIEFVFAVEQRFDIDVPYRPNDTGALEFETVSQVVAAVEKVVAEQRAAG